MHVLCEQLGRNLLRSGRRGSQGRTLSTVRPWGIVESAPVIVNGDRATMSMDGDQIERVIPVDPESITGTWESQKVSSSSVASCIVGFCSSSITDRFFHFREDGRFLFGFSSKSSRSSDMGNLNTFSNSNSKDGGDGSYTVSGTIIVLNMIVLNMDSGQVKELPLYRTRGGRLAIGLYQFSRS